MTLLNRAHGALIVVLVLLLSACQSVAPPISGQGVVQSIQETQRTPGAASAVGAVGGALVGGALGSMVGGGTGQTIATTVGAVGGAVAGSAIADQQASETVWVVNILFDDGITRAVTVTQRPNYRPGQRVVVANGAVVPK